MPKKLIIITVLITMSFFYFKSVVLANPLFLANFGIGGTNEDSADEVSDLQKKIAELEKKISNLKTQEQSLQRDIDAADSQINLTELKIQNSEAMIQSKEEEITKLEGSINKLQGRIDKLKGSIGTQEDILGSRLRERYKTKDTSALTMLFGSSTFNNLIQKAQFLKTLELEDKRLIKEMNDVKTAYGLQRNVYEDTKKKEEELKEQVLDEKANLEQFEAQLITQKREKEELLKSAQADEAKYQAELRVRRAELEAIQNITSTVTFEDGDEVEKGDVIALVGNSGYPYCSTAAHLHYETRKSGGLKNPGDYLEEKSVFVYDYEDGMQDIGDGDWAWPLKGSIKINQLYGKTPWSGRYPGGVHTGFDMGSNNINIYAPEDGILVTGTYNCYGVPLNYVAIDHGGGIVSYYLHVR